MQYKTIPNTRDILKPHVFYFLLHVCDHVPVNTCPETCNCVKRIFLSHPSRDKLPGSMFQLCVNFASPVSQLANPAGPLPVVCLSHVSPTGAISIQFQYTAEFRDSSHQAKYHTCLQLLYMPEIKLIHISHPFYNNKLYKTESRETGRTTQYNTNIMNPEQVSQYSDLSYELDDPGFVPGWRNRFPSSSCNQTSLPLNEHKVFASQEQSAG
jgi:hypothetical protein